MKLIFPLFAFLFIFSCKGKNEKMVVIPVDHPIPDQLISSENKTLSWKQDTLFSNGQLYTGKVYSMNENGDTTSIESFWKGLLEGPTKKWHINKQIAEYRYYIGGRKNGIQKSWWPNGKTKFEFNAVNDAYEGELKEWNEKGFLIKLFHHTNGQELGSQRLWWDDSTVRANYEIRNGKKYGLIGIKLCSNPYDSVNKK
jgi:antitoxin component YwqK of YwqJK toxin-antitoxin module